MTPETIRLLASEIAQQTLLSNWPFFAVLVCLTVLFSALGSFVSSYLSKRAERLAISADFNDLKRQLKESTSITESIKVELQHLSARSQKVEQLKREKLEEYLVAVLRGTEYLSLDMHNRFFGSERPSGQDPLQTASMLQKLYLPELDAAHGLFLKAVAAFRQWVVDGMQQKLEQMKSGNTTSTPSQEHLKAYSTHLNLINQTVTLIEQTSKELARELNKV